MNDSEVSTDVKLLAALATAVLFFWIVNTIFSGCYYERIDATVQDKWLEGRWRQDHYIAVSHARGGGAELVSRDRWASLAVGDHISVSVKTCPDIFVVDLKFIEELFGGE